MDFDAKSDALIGTTIDGKYLIDGLIGAGGMGVVYRAHHLGFDKTVAIKVINVSTNSAGDLQRFRREAAVLERLSHPNIVKFFAFDIFEGRPYAVLEYLEGRGLNDAWAEGELLNMPECVSIFSQILAAVAAAHEKGIVHRDLKPSNVLLVNAPDTVTPQVKVLDFGLAKALEDASAQKLTQTGALLGTPLYMSPEQCMGKPAGVQSDLYAIGCMLFECISGSPPFAGDSSYSVLVQHMSETPPQLTDRQGKPVARAAEEIILKALEKDPANRYKNADDFLEAIQSLAASAAGPAAGKRARVAPNGEVRTRKPDWRTNKNLLALASIVALCTGGALLLLGSGDKLTDPVSLCDQANSLVDSQEYTQALQLLKRAVPDKATSVDPRVLDGLKKCSQTMMTRYTFKLMNINQVRNDSTEPADLPNAATWAASRYTDLAPDTSDDAVDKVMAYRFLAQSAAIDKVEYKGVWIGGNPEKAQKYALLCYNAAQKCDQKKLKDDFWSYLGNIAISTNSQLVRMAEETPDISAKRELLLKAKQYADISMDCYARQHLRRRLSPTPLEAQAYENAAATESSLGNYSLAGELWKKAAEKFSQAKRPDLVHTSRVRHTMVIAAMKQMDEARRVCDELKATLPHVNEPFQKFQILFLDGWLSAQANDHATAEKVLAKACALADSGEMRGRGECEVRLRYAELLAELGKFSEARNQIVLAEKAVPQNLHSKYAADVAATLQKVDAKQKTAMLKR